MVGRGSRNAYKVLTVGNENMSKTNGNGHRPPPPDELRALVDEGQKLMKLLPHKGKKKEFNDICQVKGGLSRRSEAIANWMAWARN